MLKLPNLQVRAFSSDLSNVLTLTWKRIYYDVVNHVIDLINYEVMIYILLRLLP